MARDKDSRIDWVDLAKGLCIILVVMMHSTLGVEKAAGETGWMHVAVQFATPFRMPDFFLISGLFLGLVIDRPWRRYLDRKVVHFLYFYVLWMTIQFALKAPGWMGDGMGAGEIVRLYLLGFVEPFGTLWFIYALPVFFVVTRLLKALPWQVMLAAAALLEILPVQTGWLMIDEFASRYVYFLAGYLFATRIFEIVAWLRSRVPVAWLMLALWAVVNGLATFTPAPAVLLTVAGQPEDMVFWSDLPVVSLLLGAAGAMAMVAMAGTLSASRLMAPVTWIGRHSLVVYLAFFLPMAVTRALLLEFAPGLDIGTISLIVTLSAVLAPLLLHRFVLVTGLGRFLFERPGWARIEQPARRRGSLAPAE